MSAPTPRAAIVCVTATCLLTLAAGATRAGPAVAVQAAQPLPAHPPSAVRATQPAQMGTQANPVVSNAARLPPPRVQATLPSQKPVVVYTPGRIQSLQSQITLRDSENSVALSLRKYATAAAGNSASLSSGASGLANRATVAANGDRVSQLGMPKAVHQALTVTPEQMLNPPPGIWFVNNRDKNFVLTPGGYITISGKGFGDTLGQVNGFGAADGRRLTYQVLDWHDDQIYAALPIGVRGMADQGAKLQVVTSGQKTFLISTGRFYATREEITVTNDVTRVLVRAFAPQWTTTMSSAGRMDRMTFGPDIDCPGTGQDTLYFRAPPTWQVSGITYWVGRTDSGNGDGQGNGGSRVFTPGYSTGNWSETTSRDSNGPFQMDVLPFNWGVWRRHSSCEITLAGCQADECDSNYQVAVSLIGPAGVAPF